MNDRQAMFQEFTEHVMADVMFKLRDIAWIKGDEHERLRQQFTNSHILLIVTGGRGRLRLENVEHQLRQDAIYICPPMSTFGIDPDSVDELQMYVMRFDAFIESKQRRRRLRVLREEREFPLMGEVSVRSAGQLVMYCDSIAELWQQAGGIDRFRRPDHVSRAVVSHREERRFHGTRFSYGAGEGPCLHGRALLAKYHD